MKWFVDPANSPPKGRVPLTPKPRIPDPEIDTERPELYKRLVRSRLPENVHEAFDQACRNVEAATTRMDGLHNEDAGNKKTKAENQLGAIISESKAFADPAKVTRDVIDAIGMQLSTRGLPCSGNGFTMEL